MNFFYSEFFSCDLCEIIDSNLCKIVDRKWLWNFSKINGYFWGKEIYGNFSKIDGVFGVEKIDGNFS